MSDLRDYEVLARRLSLLMGDLLWLCFDFVGCCCEFSDVCALLVYKFATLEPIRLRDVWLGLVLLVLQHVVVSTAVVSWLLAQFKGLCCAFMFTDYLWDVGVCLDLVGLVWILLCFDYVYEGMLACGLVVNFLIVSSCEYYR
eukprot:gene3503-2454_t